jgi:hypothetical protein
MRLTTSITTGSGVTQQPQAVELNMDMTGWTQSVEPNGNAWQHVRYADHAMPGLAGLELRALATPRGEVLQVESLLNGVWVAGDPEALSSTAGALVYPEEPISVGQTIRMDQYVDVGTDVPPVKVPVIYTLERITGEGQDAVAHFVMRTPSTPVTPPTIPGGRMLETSITVSGTYAVRVRDGGVLSTNQQVEFRGRVEGPSPDRSGTVLTTVRTTQELTQETPRR